MKIKNRWSSLKISKRGSYISALSVHLNTLSSVPSQSPEK